MSFSKRKKSSPGEDKETAMGFHRHFGLPQSNRNQPRRTSLPAWLVFGATVFAVVVVLLVIVAEF